MNTHGRHRTALGSGWALTPLLALLCVLPAQAGPWEAVTPQGLTLVLTQNPVRNRDTVVIERRYPDRSLDRSFAQAGVLSFAMGPDNEMPGTLRLDAAGRIWVGGSSTPSGDQTQAVVLRFLPNGAPDTSWAEGGRSATAPAGRKARVQDLWPLPDGGAWVAGQVQNAQGLEQAGWWRLRPDGRVDPSLGLGGLWVDGTPGASEVVDIAVGPDGSAAVALRRGEGPSAQVEAWVLTRGASTPERLLTEKDGPGPRLVHTAGRWALHTGDAPGTTAAAAPTAPPASKASEAVVGAASEPAPANTAAPRPVSPPASAVVPAGAPQPTGVAAWWLAGSALVGGVGLLAWRRRRKGGRNR